MTSISSSLKNLFLAIFCWVTLLVMSFKVHFFEFYLPNESQNFGDLKYVLACGNFALIDVDCNQYMYGRWLLVILSKVTFLHPYPEETTIAIIGVSLIAIAHLLMNLKNNYQRFLATLLLLSPPVALLIQRGNLDILVFFLCWYAIKLFFGGYPHIGLLVAALGSVIKIYPIVLFAILITLFLTQKKSTVIRVPWLFLTGILFWIAIIDIRNIPWLPSDARNSFGLRIFGEYVAYGLSGTGKQMSPILGTLIGVAFIGIISIYVLKFSKTIRETSLLLNQQASVWILFFIFIYFSGISVDYRLIFLLPVLTIFNDLHTSDVKVFSILMVSIFYFSFPFELLQVVGDLALCTFVSILLVTIFKQKSRILART